MTSRHHEFYDARAWSWYQPYARLFANCERVLDLGCGAGLMLQALHEVGVGEAVGIERDPVFLARCRAAGLDVIGHDLNRPFPFLDTESFDGVISFQVFDYLTDVAKRIALAEAWRVLRPGGVIRVYSQSRFNERAGQDKARVGRIAASELAAMLRKAGFEDIDLEINSLVEVPGKDPKEAKQEWLLAPDDALSLTANAVARKPSARPRSSPIGLRSPSFLELWGGVQSSPIWGRYQLTPWRRTLDNPVLSPGEGDWDNLSVRDATLLTTPGKESCPVEGLMVMFYTAYGGDAKHCRRSLGRAESTDGVHWGRRPDRPVLEAGAPGEWDDGGVAAGSVIALSPSRYLMYYSGRNQDTRFVGIGLAESEDSITWKKLPGNPILSVDDYPDLRHLALADVFRTASGVWVMHMEGWHIPENGFRVYQAQGDAPDTFHPTAYGHWVLGPVVGTWESHHVANPKCLELEPNRFLMAYNGATDVLDFQLNLATSEDLREWTRLSPSPVLSHSYPPCSDGYRIESGFMLADEVRRGAPRVWYFGSDTRSVTDGCHILLAQAEPESRALDWQRWKSSYSSLYEVGAQGLTVFPGATRPDQSLHTILGRPEDTLISFAVSPASTKPGGICALGWGNDEPWLILNSEGSLAWGGQSRQRLLPDKSHDISRLALALRLKAQPDARLTAELTVWSNNLPIHQSEHPLPAPTAPLVFRCSSASDGPVWHLDHLLFMRPDDPSQEESLS